MIHLERKLSLSSGRNLKYFSEIPHSIRKISQLAKKHCDGEKEGEQNPGRKVISGFLKFVPKCLYTNTFMFTEFNFIILKTQHIFVWMMQ